MTDHPHAPLEAELRQMRRTTRGLRRWALVLGVVLVVGTIGLFVAHTRAQFAG